ncbi:hypothetical protein [Encephalitozoon cuniculi GB-M1]|uniref:DUF1764-domain-containing protein n=1 Tax=Encephalitozoon cuniculi (strain GB-M1) TaxID=284813 RepID=Q8SW58_ENCCU|nr:uncharacterized protein ECU03_0450 [Encephalitozoon cuniculi GB-M1]CAD26191.1 hypothetical protein [Encephalitozoon cuniculi GB-M1]
MRRVGESSTGDRKALRSGLKRQGSADEDDIESIFSGIGSARINEPKAKKDDDESNEEKYFSVGKDGRRYHEGLPVYTTEELHLGDGGGDTEDCPIYCDCCL